MSEEPDTTPTTHDTETPTDDVNTPAADDTDPPRAGEKPAAIHFLVATHINAQGSPNQRNSRHPFSNHIVRLSEWKQQCF